MSQQEVCFLGREMVVLQDFGVVLVGYVGSCGRQISKIAGNRGSGMVRQKGKNAFSIYVRQIGRENWNAFRGLQGGGVGQLQKDEKKREEERRRKGGSVRIKERKFGNEMEKGWGRNKQNLSVKWKESEGEMEEIWEWKTMVLTEQFWRWTGSIEV